MREKFIDVVNIVFENSKKLSENGKEKFENIEDWTSFISDCIKASKEKYGDEGILLLVVVFLMLYSNTGVMLYLWSAVYIAVMFLSFSDESIKS